MPMHHDDQTALLCPLYSISQYSIFPSIYSIPTLSFTATSRRFSDSGGLARSGVLGVILGRHAEANKIRRNSSHLHQIPPRQSQRPP
jgi:hypothetical protein